MALPADVVIAALRSGARLRISGAGLAPNVIQSYASAAKDGGSHITIVMGEVALLHHVMEAIGAAGRGHVTLDFVGLP
jgi:hypothetical protein